jgi:CubicO group peptidase (beta-lactamase class C family)
MSFAVRNLVGAGVITPDDPLEDLLREEMDLPKRDPETARAVPTPQGGPDPEKPDEEDPAAEDGEKKPDDAEGGRQAKSPRLQPPKPARVGPPRQSKPSAKAPGTGGQDRSGGK